MGQYLNKFKNIIGSKQTEQVIKLLNKKKADGQIRNIAEFSEQLQSLLRDLTSTELSPSLKLWAASAHAETSSEQYNFMLDRVEDDLEAAFLEANNIDEVQQAHTAIVRDVLLKNLRAGIAELESKVNLYKLLNESNNNFDNAIFSTFRESKSARLRRTNAATKSLFIDPRKKESIPVTEDTSVDIIGERLILGSKNTSYHTIKTVTQIFDTESSQSELIVDPPNVSVNNIIDDQTGTYWVQSLLFKEKPDTVKFKFEFDLGQVQEVNFIEIEPAVFKDLILESVDYIDGNNILTNLNVNEITFDGPTAVRIRKAALKKIILTFRNEHFTPIEFEYNDIDNLTNQTFQQPAEGFNPNINNVTNDLLDIISSIEIQNIIGLSSTTNSQFNGYQFVNGLDNIRIGLADFNVRGIYVSDELNTNDIGQIALKASESRPYLDDNVVTYTDATYSDNGHYLSSIEYWVIKQDFSDAGTLLNTAWLPILPADTSEIFHERLVLNEKSDTDLADPDIGSTMFFTNATASEGNIRVYRNGILMENRTGTTLSNGWQWYNQTNTEDRTPGSGTPMSFKIQVGNIFAGDIFTASYQPLNSSVQNIPSTLNEFTSVGGAQIVDLIGNLTAYRLDTQSIIINKEDSFNTLKTNKLYLAIIIRQNTADTSISSAVEDFTLLASNKNILKFEDN